MFVCVCVKICDKSDAGHFWYCMILLYPLTSYKWIMDFSLPRPFAPRSKSSMCGTFASCNVRSRQWIQQGAKVPTKCIDLHIRNFRCHVTVKLARSAWTVLSRVVIQYTIIRCINEMDSLNVHSYSPLHLAYIWHTLWTIIIETS